MSHNCDSCDAKSIALPNTPSTTNSTQSGLIPNSVDLKGDIGTATQILNPISNTISPQAILTPGTHYERCLHWCKARMYRLIENETNRVQFQPIKYSGKSKFAKLINENFSTILVDGAPDRHLSMCKCKRLLARHSQFLFTANIHLKSEFHSNAFQTSLHEPDGEARIDEPHTKILKLDSCPRPRSPIPPISSSNEAIPPPAIMEPPSTQSSHVSQDFLDRKYKLEALLWIEPRLFVFMPAQSIQIPLYKPTAIFREFAIPGFQTDDLVVCTSCVSILNNYPNDLWNVETHRATHLHFENVKSFRGIQVKNFDFNILRRDFD